MATIEELSDYGRALWRAGPIPDSLLRDCLKALSAVMYDCTDQEARERLRVMEWAFSGGAYGKSPGVYGQRPGVCAEELRATIELGRKMRAFFAELSKEKLGVGEPGDKP